jgi:hypothetical protein
MQQVLTGLSLLALLAGSPQLAVCGADIAQEAGSGSDRRGRANFSPPDQLEGLHLGDTRSIVDRRFKLGSQVPFHEGEEERYILDTKLLLPNKVRREMENIAAVRMEFRFRHDRLTSVRVEYDAFRETRFDEMEEKLLAIYRTPSRVQERGPMSVGRAHGIRLYMWLRIWSWEWPDRMLVVEGKHYGDDKREEQPLRHAYTYTLSRRSTP